MRYISCFDVECVFCLCHNLVPCRTWLLQAMVMALLTERQSNDDRLGNAQPHRHFRLMTPNIAAALREYDEPDFLAHNRFVKSELFVSMEIKMGYHSVAIELLFSLFLSACWSSRS